jgi:hypothetical protein
MTEYQWMNNEEAWPSPTAEPRIWHDLNRDHCHSELELVGVNIRVKPFFEPGWFQNKYTPSVARWLTADPGGSNGWQRVTDLTEAP